MNILITGGYGAIGRKLVVELDKINHVKLYLISRSIDLKKRDTKITTISHDLLEPIPDNKIPSNINIVIHLAALAHDSNADVMEVNCLITKNIVNAFVNKKVKFLFFSSVAVYGEAKRKFPIKTTDYCKPSSLYGRGKVKDEVLISSSFQDHIILRICPVIGDDDTDLLKRVYLPGTMIKYKSSYNRDYSFASHTTISKVVLNIIEGNYTKGRVINLRDSQNYCESYILAKYPGKAVKFPWLVTQPLFALLNVFSFFPVVYKINCLLTKMLKINTYE